MFSNLGSGMLGLEPLQRQPQPPPPPEVPPQQNPHQRPQNPFRQQQAPPPPTTAQMVTFALQEPDHHQPQTRLSMKQTTYTFMPKAKQQNQQQANSDEDDPGFGNDDSSADGKRKASPWQRMKWTDGMVKMLIMAVFYIGDEAAEGNEKKKSGGSLQKKGKWKSVSRAMMEKGFKVSPQQCEDKFNDLNKRYKRVVEILGKGTACGIVENQSLLETVDLTPKMKEEAKKLLNSKHLFFKEMCAYHNSCAHFHGKCSAGIMAASGGSGVHHSPEVSTEQGHIHHQQQQHQHQCFHSLDNPSAIPGSNRVAPEESSKMKGLSGENEVDSEDDDDDEDEDDDDEDDDDHDDDEDEGLRKKARRETSATPMAQQLNSEITSVLQDGTKSPWEKKQWMMARLVELQEQGLKYKIEAFEIAKQRVRWIKFCSKKEKEMKRMKLENQRRRVENERMLLVLRQKELEMFEQQQNPPASRFS